MAFDILWLDGKDLRGRPLIERKRILRSIIPVNSASLVYASFIVSVRRTQGVRFGPLTSWRA